MNIIFYGAAMVLLLVSWFKDQQKTKMALKKAWKAFENILPEFLFVILLVGFMLAAIEPSTISKWIGDSSGLLGLVVSGVVGAVTLIPAFVAFPTAALLLEGGAGYVQIGAFVSTLMMVGVVTLPIESKYFGKKMAIYRNLLAFGFSFVIAAVIGVVLK